MLSYQKMENEIGDTKKKQQQQNDDLCIKMYISFAYRIERAIHDYGLLFFHS